MLAPIRAWFLRAPDCSQDDLAEEIDDHIEMLKEERSGLGVTPDQADGLARRKFGNRTSIREAVYETRTLAFFDAWAMYLRIAMRSLLRNKAAYIW